MPHDLVPFESRIAAYAVRSKAAHTVTSYRRAMAAFRAWCDEQGREVLGDLDAVAGYMASLADRQLAASTVRLHFAAIKEAHRLADVPFDAGDRRLKMVMDGITRTLGRAAKRKAAAAVPDVLRRFLAVCLPAEDAMGARDRAMLLVGFGAGLRRSELVALRVQDVTFVEDKGLIVQVTRSKTDQEGVGEELAVWKAETEPGFCAVRAMEVWLVHRARASDSARPESALFCQVGKGKHRKMTGHGLTDRMVARVVKKHAEAAGLDASRFSGHSLRRGMVTAGSEEGEDMATLMRQSRHKSVQSVLEYIEHSDMWRKNVTRKLFR